MPGPSDGASSWPDQRRSQQIEAVVRCTSPSRIAVIGPAPASLALTCRTNRVQHVWPMRADSEAQSPGPMVLHENLPFVIAHASARTEGHQGWLSAVSSAHTTTFNRGGSGTSALTSSARTASRRAGACSGRRSGDRSGNVRLVAQRCPRPSRAARRRLPMAPALRASSVAAGVGPRIAELAHLLVERLMVPRGPACPALQPPRYCEPAPGGCSARADGHRGVRLVRAYWLATALERRLPHAADDSCSRTFGAFYRAVARPDDGANVDLSSRREARRCRWVAAVPTSAP